MALSQECIDNFFRAKFTTALASLDQTVTHAEKECFSILSEIFGDNPEMTDREVGCIDALCELLLTYDAPEKRLKDIV